MNLIKIGNKWINLELVTAVYEIESGLDVYFADATMTRSKGAEAKALAQLLDNMSTKVMVTDTEDAPQS